MKTQIDNNSGGAALMPLGAGGVGGVGGSGGVGPVKRGRLVAVRLSEDEFQELIEYRRRCPMPEVPLAIFLRQLLSKGIAASGQIVVSIPKSTPKVIKHRSSASRGRK